MKHLTVRVAWHDSRWDGTICTSPLDNSFCISLDRIRAEKDDLAETRIAQMHWADLENQQLPPCIAESGGFMSPRGWLRTFKHPYQEIRKAQATHGKLRNTSIKVPPFSTFAVPFWWMNNDHQQTIDELLSNPLPPDEKSPFHSPWVFGHARQEALLDLMFGQLREQQSLVLFYAKEGTPLGERFSRLLVGIGTLTRKSDLLRYESDGPTTYPLWDRLIEHSIRPNEADGFLLPYHDYLGSTGDQEEDERRLDLLNEIVVAPIAHDVRTFSYGAELAADDTALSMLVQCLQAVRKIREHGIAEGPWERREEWLNRQIAAVWKHRGAFPGIGSALEAVGLRLGTSLCQELMSSGVIGSDENPWAKVDEVLSGTRRPPQQAYEPDIAAMRTTWKALPEERRHLLELLSRFDLSPEQAKRWYDQGAREQITGTKVEDHEILANPYVIAESDLGDGQSPAIAIGRIDRGLMADSTIAAAHPVPAPSAVLSQMDVRRVRAALVTVLRAAAVRGDSLLSVAEVQSLLPSIDLSHPCVLDLDWLRANADSLSDMVSFLELPQSRAERDGQPVLQLTDLKDREERLGRILLARTMRDMASVGADWEQLLRQVISERGATFDETNPRHREALAEQSVALEKITTRKLGVLVGRAGTGKTSVMGALLKHAPLLKGGILLLAPTGKARVRLGQATSAEAKTVAQFLNDLGRYDPIRQRPLFVGERYRKEKTVVIDECSMLTLDDLAAVLEALDLVHVDRLILVGDPNQLPPIGVGRPFADLAGYLEAGSESGDLEAQQRAAGFTRLTVEVRSVATGVSDTLRLASWFTREAQPVGADRIFTELETGIDFNDLSVVMWNGEEELREQLMAQFIQHLGLNFAGDVNGFNLALGMVDGRLVDFANPEPIEDFQLLSPVRMHPHGVHELNRWIQSTFRASEIRAARRPGGLSLGDEGIVIRDKVIHLRNQRRDAWDGRIVTKEYVANGEIAAISHRGKRRDGSYVNILNAVFASRPGLSFGYRDSEFRGGVGPIELAYVLTVHKAQGSEFRKVFFILPKNNRIISRELMYTALTRSRDQLVLLVEGNDLSSIFELSKPERSETMRRNSNLFASAVRESSDSVPYAEHLIHRVDKGHMVRSISELAIANILYNLRIEYSYERPLEGVSAPGRVWPDFSFEDPAGDLVIWEHLGMLNRDDYLKNWEWKREWYAKNGFELGRNLFTSEYDERGGLDSHAIRATAERIRSLI